MKSKETSKNFCAKWINFPSESQYHQEKYVTNPASLKKKTCPEC